MNRRTTPPPHRQRVETSLELKCLLLFGLSLLVVVLVSSWLHWQLTQDLVQDQNPRTGRLLVDHIVVIEHYALFQENDPDFVKMLENLEEDLIHQEYERRFIKPPSKWAADPDSAPVDEFERKVFEQFQLPPEDGELAADYVDRIEVVGDQEIYQYYRAIRAGDNATTDCASCHKQFRTTLPLTEGDLIAVAQVSFPNEARKTVRWSLAWLISVAVITAVLALAAFYVVIRYLIIRPLRHLRDVSDAISRSGDIAQRAEIHTGDEFEALAIAFNRMLRHVTSVQDELRSTNTDLDNKVDELAQANVRLYEMNRLKGDFMATMSHELRTPLNSILGFSDVLGSIDTLDDRQKRYVENIRKSGHRLLTMINDVLDLAKAEAGRAEVRCDECRIEQIVATQCDMAKPLLDKKNLDIEIEMPNGLPPMYQDESRLQQILNNLLSNAIKFTPDGGRIRVVAQREQAPPVKEKADAEPEWNLTLQVIDTGVGIAEEDRQAIFEKFRQGQSALSGGDAMTREASGSGLGLSIVREICRLLHGSIDVDSELGMGSTFTVRVPWKLISPAQPESGLPEQFDEFARIWHSRTGGAD